MPTFDPTRPPAMRLARLGVVLDAAAPDEAVRLALLCDRAGIDAGWVADRAGLTGTEAAIAVGSVWSLALSLAAAPRRSRVGVILGNVPEDLLLAPADGAGPDEITMAAAQLSWVPRMPGQGPRVGAIVDDLSATGRVLGVADDIVLPGWAFDDLETAADEVRATAAEVGRDPATLGVAVLVPVSVGRTQAEAEARADADAAFWQFGRASEAGIFGTLEECQDRVIALAHAGVTDVRCLLPTSVDAHDVIAQLTAIAVGTTAVLMPGSLRSPAPPPPEGWGGRPDRPPADRISGGSKRR